MELDSESGRRVLIDMERTEQPESRTNTERLLRHGMQQIRPVLFVLTPVLLQPADQVAGIFSVHLSG